MSEQESDGSLGVYEKRLCLLLFLSSIPNAFPLLQVVVTQYKPSFRCALQELRDNATDELQRIGRNLTQRMNEELLNYSIPWKMENEVYQRSSCTRFNISHFKVDQLNNTQDRDAEKNLSILPCRSYHFDGHEVSAVTEFGLVCESEWLDPFLASLFFFGTMFGMIIGGFFSDRFGRRPCFLIFTAWQFVATFALSMVHDVVWYGIIVFIIGMGSLMNYLAATIIGSEMLPKRYRLLSYFCLTCGYAIGTVVTALAAYLFPNWRWFLRFTSIIGVLYIPYYWLIDETPKWLIASGRRVEAEKVLIKIATINKKHFRTINYIEKNNEDIDHVTSMWKTFVELGKEPVLFGRFLVECFAWCVLSLIYYAISYNVNNLSGNRFLNMFFLGLVECASKVPFFLLMKYRGRVESYIALLGLSAVCFGTTGIIHKVNGTAVVALTMLSKLFVSVAFSTVYLHTPEIFPTKIRQSSIGLASACARVGGLIAPYAVVGMRKNVMGTSLGIAGMALMSCALYGLLPETNDFHLPQNIQEAKEMKSCLKSFCSKKNLEAKETNPNPNPLPITPFIETEEFPCTPYA